MADQVLYSGVACITDLMVKEGLINLDFADVRSVMREMGKAMMGTGEASGEGRAMAAAEAAIANPLLDETSMRGAKGLLISITGGRDLTLFEVDEAATRIREEVDQDANIILGATFDEDLEGVIRVSVVATGIDKTAAEIAAAPIAIRQPPKQPLAPGLQPKFAPLLHAAREVRTADPVAEAIRAAEMSTAEVAAHARPTVRSSPRTISARRASCSSRRRPSRSSMLQQVQPAPQPAPVVQQREASAGRAAAAAHAAGRGFPAGREGRGGSGPARSRADHEDSGPMGLLKRLTNGLSPPRGRAGQAAACPAARAEAAPAGAGSAPPRQPGPAALRAAPRPARRARPPDAAAASDAGRRPAGDSGVPAPAGQLSC